MIDIREGGLGHPAVEALLAHHRAEAHASTPARFAHAMASGDLASPEVRFFCAWRGDDVLGMGALKRIGYGHAEIKSMRVAPPALGQGVGRTILLHLIATAREAGYRQLSLETGTAPMFAAARSLYEGSGFVACDAFGGYPPSPHNRFMTLAL